MVYHRNCGQRLRNAVEALVGEAPLRVRVNSAFTTLIPLNAREFPEENEEEFQCLLSEMSRARSLSDEGVASLNERVVALAIQVIVTERHRDFLNLRTRRNGNRRHA